MAGWPDGRMAGWPDGRIWHPALEAGKSATGRTTTDDNALSDCRSDDRALTPISGYEGAPLDGGGDWMATDGWSAGTKQKGLTYAELLSMASSALKGGDPVGCLEALDLATAHRPDPDIKRLRLEARAAQKAKQPARALTAWKRRAEKFDIPLREKVQYARALVDAGAFAEGLDLLFSLLQVPETAFSTASYLAVIHSRLGHFAAAQEARQIAFETAPESHKLQARIERAQAWHKAGNSTPAIAEFSALMATHPDSIHVACDAIQIFLDIRQFAATEALLAKYLKDHPNSGALLRIKAKLLNLTGDERHLVAFCETMVKDSAQAEEVPQIISALFAKRGMFLLAESKEAIRRCCKGILSTKTVEAILERPDLQIQLQGAELRLTESITGTIPWLQASADRTVTLISLGRLVEAEEQVDRIKEVVANWPYFPPRHASLREWLDVRRGAVQAAQRSWRSRRMHGKVTDRSSELVSTRDWSGRRPDVAVFCQLRNERPIVESFLAHYRRGGIEAFSIVDNGSDDGTFEFLQAQPDVELFSTREDFRRARAGNDWINPLIGRSEFAETLCLRVDADEHLVFPFYEERSFGALWTFMKQEGAEAISGRMLDMFPETLRMLDDPEGGMASCRYFDPFCIPVPIVDCPYVRYTGGTRTRLLDGKFQSIGKVSGIRGGGSIDYISASHSCSPAKVSTLDIALLHYKFYPGFLQKIERVLQEKQHATASQEYAHYNTLAERVDEYLPGPGSMIFEGTPTLMSPGICRCPPGWQN
ncbi:glycosyltransferase family 2 protein [Pararoseomonas indoligenes]|uniref:Glycosyltransferase family 2 protein n=1 Tax=Roseomonas indoligenes TaxID=2820811 RepID=A0A940N341_9PROT|nr:glycosyltransferase family 2 protein [Pararoseomonas indoligenes]MBP0495699.1 glycosyltransferase family 2 protein [Pararoseomonas indoligenes]